MNELNDNIDIRIKNNVVTYMLLVTNVLAYIIGLAHGNDNFMTGGVNYEYVTINKEYIRFFSYMFIHGNLSHLANNMLALWFIGCRIESKFGSFRMMLIYSASGLLGGIISMYMNHSLNPDIMHYSVGASAAVYGILCATFILSFRTGNKTKPEDLLKAIGFIVIYSLLTIRGNVDGWGHVGGGVVGGITTFLVTIRRWEDFLENKFFKLIGIIFTINLCIIGVCGARIGKEQVPLNDERIDEVKATAFNEDKPETIGFYLDKCDNARWKVFVTKDNKEVVEFTGSKFYDGNIRNILAQFIRTEDGRSWEVTYFAMDDKPLKMSQLEKFLDYLKKEN